MTAKQREQRDREIHQRVLDRISSHTREEWLEMIARYEAEYAAADAEQERLLKQAQSTPAHSHERAA